MSLNNFQGRAETFVHYITDKIIVNINKNNGKQIICCGKRMKQSKVESQKLKDKDQGKI
jgi:hypothetical protein